MNGDFSIKSKQVADNCDALKNIGNGIVTARESVNNVYSNLSISGDGQAYLKSSISIILKELQEERKSAQSMEKILGDVVNLYQTTEALISAQQMSDYHIDYNAGSSVDESSTSEEDESTDAEMQKAIETLNAISMSTSIDGVALAVVEYLIKLVNLEAETGIFSSLGNAATVIGLITGIAADIMNGIENNLSSNEIAGDIIADIIIAGVGVGATAIGSAIGTAIGGPVGTVVGNFIGGVVGNGASIILNLDFDGDGKTGKDNMSDWICDSLDFMMGTSDGVGAIA